VKAFRVNIAVPFVGGGPVEGAVAEAIDLNFAGPYVGVESLEVVFVDQTELKSLVSKRISKDATTMDTNISLTVRPDGEESNHTGADEAQQDEDSHNEIVPSCALHGLVAEPWLLIFSNEPIALEYVLGAAHC
jgi:hypothetical protein